MMPIPMFPGFDGLMTLSRREGVDIRPTLLRVLTDLYVQTPSHTSDEERQFVALTARLIDEVDDATRAAVRARLSIYPHTPSQIADKLELNRTTASAPRASRPEPSPASPLIPAEDEATQPTILTIEPHDAFELNTMFFAADGSERVLILHNLASAPLRPASRIDTGRAERSIAALERMALEADMFGFIEELAQVLMLPIRLAQQIAEDPSGEPLACAARALGMSGETYERILLFLDPELGASVQRVYRLSRLYDTLSERVALIVLAAWRGTSLTASRAKYQPALHHDERQRARSATLGAVGRPASVQNLPGTLARGDKQA